jgi:putative Ig domain-containing protein
LKTNHLLRHAGSSFALICALSLTACQLTSPGVRGEGSGTSADAVEAAQAPDASQLVIDTISLPGTYPRAQYLVRLQQHGGVPPFHWRVEKGDLPPGLKLEDEGTLHGSPEKVGEYRFTIAVRDGSKPEQAVQREYVLNVAAAMSMKWKTPAHVVGNRVEGSVEVSNTTPEDFDFTFIVLAVNEVGRATAIGYQRFPLKKGTTDFELPFGDTLPHGAYVVHVDAVGEVEEKNLIHRTRLQTPAALQVAVGP